MGGGVTEGLGPVPSHKVVRMVKSPTRSLGVRMEILMTTPCLMVPVAVADGWPKGVPVGVRSRSPQEVILPLTYAQRKQLQRREKEEKPKDYHSETLDAQYAENLRSSVASVSPEEKSRAHEAWMNKLKQGDFDGPVLDRSRYLSLRN